MVSNFLQRIPREYAEDVRVESYDVVDEVIFEQMDIKTGEVIDDPRVPRSDQGIGRGRLRRRNSSAGLDDVSIVGRAAHWIDVEFYCVSEKTSEGLQDAALEIFVVLLVKYCQQMVDPNRDTNHFLGVAPEI